MLRRTFLHLPGVGEATELRWWRNGVRDWSDALAAARRADQQDELRATLAAWAHGDWAYFDRVIGNVHKWRAWPNLRKSALCVDIETDGGYGPESITMIGTYDGQTARTFTADENLQDAADHLEGFPLLVTYNGVFFDMPLIRQRFTHRLRNHLHLDLRFPLHRLGYRGGLKQIEKALNLARPPETDGLTGWDAVRLWRESRAGSSEALRLLKAYNAEDARNLWPLAEHVFAMMSLLTEKRFHENSCP